MKTLYLDCGMGAAGDMLSAALLELTPDPQAFVEELNAIGIPNVTFQREDAVKCGIRGTRLRVLIDGAEEGAAAHGHSHGEAHPHGDLHGIEHVVADHLALEQTVRDDVLAVFRLLAEAESRVHGVPVEHIHFHEVGTMDAVADITAVCLLLYRLAPDEIVASPVHVGSGTVVCAHGELPVPAPATAELLQGVPIYGGSIPGELCTPTGAALLKHFVTRFGDLPVMKPVKIGCGMGKKDFARANCLRAILGGTETREDDVVELSCNVDDMTGEEIGCAMERLYDAGALEVFTTPIGMKKSRPGVRIGILCRAAERETILAALFRHTSTIGVREVSLRRYVLDRSVKTVETPYGAVRRKDAAGFGAEKRKYEFDDLARIARGGDFACRGAAADRKRGRRALKRLAKGKTAVYRSDVRQSRTGFIMTRRKSIWHVFWRERRKPSL